jgi:anti-sigma factor RsiW
MSQGFDSLLVRYHLGELSPGERDAVEDRYFADDAFHEQVLAAEEELIDSYVRGELSAEQSKHFESWFLQADDRRERLEFAKALAGYTSAQAMHQAVDQTVRQAIQQTQSSRAQQAIAYRQVLQRLPELSDKDKALVFSRCFAYEDEDKLCIRFGVSRRYLEALMHRVRLALSQETRDLSSPTAQDPKWTTNVERRHDE